MSDRGSTPSPTPTLADQGVGATQVIDLADVDLSVALAEARKVVPPPLPPEEILRASQAPPPPSLQPYVEEQQGSRSTRFYVAILAACLVAFVAAGAVIARSMRSDAPSPAPSASVAGAKPGAGRVITISPVEMTDDVDAGRTK
jgi:hypothetical protein